MSVRGTPAVMPPECWAVRVPAGERTPMRPPCPKPSDKVIQRLPSGPAVIAFANVASGNSVIVPVGVTRPTR